MVKCPFCQFDNEDGALFCEQCKSDLASVAPTPAAAPPPPPPAPEPIPMAAPLADAHDIPMAAPLDAGPHHIPMAAPLAEGHLAETRLEVN